MTLKIEINLHPEGGNLGEQLVDHMDALGFFRQTASPVAITAAAQPVIMPAEIAKAEEPEGKAAASEAQPEAAEDPDKRAVGASSDGRARRTKAEISEDEELTKLAATAGVTLDKLNGAIAQVGRSDAENALNETILIKFQSLGEKPQISSGEERVGPEDDAETQAQDAADEKAEVDANRDKENPVTVNDLKDAMGKYVEKFGLADTQVDGPVIFADALGTPPEGEQFWKVTLVGAQGQDALNKAIAAWLKAASSETRYKAK